MKSLKNLKAFLLISDILGILLVYFFAYWIRFRSGLVLPVDTQTPVGFYLVSLFVFIPVAVFWFMTFRMYVIRRHLRSKVFIHRIILSVLFTIATTLTLLFWYRDILFSRKMMLLAGLLLIIYLLSSRILVLKWIRLQRKKGFFLDPAVIIGSVNDIRKFHKSFISDPEPSCSWRGCFIPPGESAPEEKYHCLGSITDYLEKKLDEAPRVTILLESEDIQSSNIDIIRVSQERNTEVLFLPTTFNVVPARVDLKDLRGMPIFSVVPDKRKKGVI